MTLLEESDEFVIIVSPYVKISKWYKLQKKFENLKKRNIHIEFIIRKDKTNQRSFEELDQLKIKYTAIPDLHCKLYLNEKYAIVSSMNLLLSSEINSLELGYVTESVEEYHELIEFCKRHLNINFENFKESAAPAINDNWIDSVEEILNEKLNQRIRIQEDESGQGYNIKTRSNNYSCFIWSEKENKLRISGVLSKDEYDFINSNSMQILQVKNLKIDIQKGSNGYYDMVWATSELNFQSCDLMHVPVNEMKTISLALIRFIVEVERIKSSVS
jgi:hypothetical protein